ncbi:GntR family transcriptional regulator [Tardiphaga sp.]|uniref:GntR family transcriptional regulator n=1 Tax=Tardiphaga sp. TaxID=1926292 RepID=UPI00352A43F2
MLATDARLPRYHRLRDSLAQRIAAGEWQAGASIPSESELAAAYDVSIGTVRRAIDILETDGLIERVHGRGMYVRRANFGGSLFRFFRVGGSDSPEPVSDIKSRRIVPACAQVARHLKLRGNVDVVHIVRRRLADDIVLLREDIWLPARIFAPIVDMPLSELSLLYPVYEKRFGKVVARARERLSIETADEVICRDLGVESGSPLVRIERSALNHSGEPIEWRVSFGAAGRFTYEIEVS